MMGLRIALQTRRLAQPLRQALHTAARLGVDGVQLDLRHEWPAAEITETAARHLRKLLDDLNLRVGSIQFPTRRGFAEAEALEQRVDAAVQALRAASLVKTRLALIMLGNVPAEDDPARGTLLESLALLARHGSRLGVQIALQAPAAAPNAIQALLTELPEGLLGVDVNPAALLLSGQRPREYAAALGPLVLHVFANDAVRGSPGLPGSDVVLGRGSADFPELLAALEEHDYRGWLTVEPPSRSEAAAADAVQFLKSL